MSVRTILVGVDDSEGSRAALRWAADLAADLKARIVVAHVFEPLAHLGETPKADLLALRERTRSLIEDEVCRPLRERGLDYATLILQGTPAEALVDAADDEQADLIVAASRRLGRVKELLLGSTSKALVQLTRRPVVIIHPPR